MYVLILFPLAALAAAHCRSCGTENSSIPISYDLPYATRVTTFTDNPVSTSLFGAVAVTPAPIAPAYQHPRVVQSATEWNDLLHRYADPDYFDTPGSWSRHHRFFTVDKGPHVDIISLLSEMELNGDTDVYTGGVDMLSLTSAQRTALEPLVSVMSRMDEFRSTSLFMCALWTGVQEILLDDGRLEFLAVTTDDCIRAATAWAKVLLAHRAYHCAGACVGTVAADRAYVWDYNLRFEVRHDWHTAGAGLALCYDVLYGRMTDEQRKAIRSALSMIVLKKASWGNTVTSDRRSPNAVLHPHRIFSNWAMYHSNLYIANLAIEGETGANDFDEYAQSVLTAEGETGFNAGLSTRFEAMIDAYMVHSIYPDGSTFEDGYTYFIALREGSLGLLAAHRRGITVFNTDRFRNLIHNVAQMLEPWHCGQIVGHASGGGIDYPAWAGLFRYVYPNGALPNMVWRQRMGDDFRSFNPCRTDWFQNMMQLSILGGEHGPSTFAESPAGLEPSFSQHFTLSYYTPRRGLLIARAGLEEDKVYMHFDARPDAFIPGHDNADRGVFTFSALRRTWFDDYWWRENLDSRKHSIMHVDGLAQDEKAPSVHMVRATDDGAVVIAVANLTYAYNVQWARNWPDHNPPVRDVVTYLPDGTETRVSTLFEEKEYGHPQDFGWPLDDDGTDLGFTRESFNMHGDPDLGFLGMWTWKRKYREVALTHGVRSMGLVRQSGTPGYGVIVDAFGGGNDSHVFESYLMLRDGVSVDSGECEGSECKIVLGDGDAQLDVHVIARGVLGYRTESFSSDKTHSRLIVKSSGVADEVMYVGLHAHRMEPETFAMTKAGEDVRIVYYGNERVFGLDSGWGLIEKDEVMMTPTPEQEASPTPAAASPTPAAVSPTPAMASPTPAMASPTPAAASPTPAAASPTPAMASPTPAMASPTPAMASPTPAMASPTPAMASPTPAMASPTPVMAPPTPATASPTPATVSPTPEYEGPMEAEKLAFRRNLKLRVSNLESDSSKFYVDNGADFQRVFTIVSRTNRRNVDRLITCARFTTARTKLMVLSCGDEAEYQARACSVVSNGESVCQDYKTDLRQRLTRGDTYYVVLSVWRRRRSARVLLKHVIQRERRRDL